MLSKFRVLADSYYYLDLNMKMHHRRVEGLEIDERHIY